MNKTTLKGFLTFLCVFCVSVVSAQQQLKKNTKSIEDNNTTLVAPLQLTEDNQRSLEETGYVRCVSVEMHERRQQKAGTSGYDDAFENWIEPLIEAKRLEIEQAKANGTFQKAVVNVPIIFHVITSGTGPTNLSDAIIQSQIDQLNLDFSDQGGVNGTQSAYAVSADAEIVFVPATMDPDGNPLAVPGVNRVTTFGAGPFADTDFDLGDGGLEIKPATIWDRSVYANVWTADLQGGLLGYAQFPSNSTLPGFPADGGSALNDGVVCGYGTIGSRDLPGSAPPYNLGRTLTHEVGHWIGLRHIWGDGNCNADDFVDDTPNAGSSNFGCPTGTNSCTGGQNPGDDMIENYMDYTDDSCMDLFTAGQVLRIETVLTNADGISNLPNSTAADPVPPTIFYPNQAVTTVEGSDCSFTDIAVELSLLPEGPSAIATANLSVVGGTAVAGADFDLITPTVNFAAGVTASQNMTIRIYNDGFIEGDETVIINFTVSGGNAVAGTNNTLTLTIQDDDMLPNSTSVTNTTVLDSDFETADTTVWTNLSEDGEAANDWATFNGLNYTGIDGVFGGSLSNDLLGGGANYSPDNFNISPAIVVSADATNITFNYGIGAFSDSEPYEVYWTTNISNAAGITGGTLLDSGNAISGGGEIKNISSNSISNQTGYFVVRHNSQGNGAAQTNGALLLDNVTIVIEETISSTVQTSINTGANSYETNLSGTGTIYTSNSSTGDVMLNITNNDTFDYGCTNIAVSREGTGAQAYGTSVAPNLVMDKTFTITPTNTATSGDTNITFYFDASEINGWQTATGLTSTDLVALREGDGEVVSLTVSAFGSDTTLTGNFTGLAGTYYFGPADAFRISVAPVVYLQGAALNPNTGEETLMRDDLRVEGLIPTTSPYVDNLTCNASVFNVTGANAIVDWVYVELRDELTNTLVAASTSALLQRDGDVVDVDGVSPLSFGIASANYYVTIKHRNHLGVMSKDTILLDATTKTVDFTDGSISTFGTDGQTTFGMTGGKSGMWSGDATGNGLLNYLGAQSETPSIRAQVFNDPNNSVFGGPPAAGYLSLGYNATDINMDGYTVYSGPTTDVLIVRNNIFNNPSNSVFGGPPSASYNFIQQLPEGTN